jgi:endonuclease-3 related protein
MGRSPVNKRLLPVFDRLLQHHGPQHWWPGDTPFEVMVGAVLTQNTAWINVEKAIANLKDAGLLDAHAVAATSVARLARHLRPAGYFNVKAQRLHNFCRWYLEQGGYRRLSRWNTAALRRALLSVNGVGRETADDILLYAFNRAVFVIDAYTRRMFTRLGVVSGDEDYDVLRRHFEDAIIKERRAGGPAAIEPRALAAIYNEYHALIVNHAKDVCRVKPRCGHCCLRARCPGVVAGD